MTYYDAGLIIFVLLVAWSFYRAHHDKTPFNMFDLIMENGRLSKFAVMMWGAFAAITWVFIKLAATGHMTEGFFIGYAGACFSPVIAKLFSPPVATTVKTESSSSSITTPILQPEAPAAPPLKDPI